jgi:segregation and condensation protein B
MEQQKVKNIIESILLAADKPLDVKFIETLFESDMDRPGRDQIMQALQSLAEDYQNRGIRLNEVASGYRMQVVEDYAPWVARLWEEKPQRYSRALLETLVLIAYRQPITRGEIEEIRGVSVSTQTTKTLLERDWIRVLGHKDVPGKPAMYGTTRTFLDYFSLKTLDELPALSEIKDLDKLYPELALEDQVAVDQVATEVAEATTDPDSEETMITGGEEQTADTAE